MFSLIIIRDSIKLSASKLRHDFVDAIILALNQKYCNRVIINVGLAVSVLDLLEAGDPYIHAGEAAAHIKVKFRLVIFRPLVGELLEGRVRSSSSEGIHVSLGFFDDILIPPGCMQPDTTFDPTEQAWVWTWQGDTQMYLDNGERIRFRVLGEKFEEVAPLSKEALMVSRNAALPEERDNTSSNPNNNNNNQTVSAKPPAPYQLIASIGEDGLGLIRWWQATDVDNKIETVI